MKWYWWLIIVFVPLGIVAYFFYQAGANKDKMAIVRAGKDKPKEPSTAVNSDANADLKINE